MTLLPVEGCLRDLKGVIWLRITTKTSVTIYEPCTACNKQTTASLCSGLQMHIISLHPAIFAHLFIALRASQFTLIDPNHLLIPPPSPLSVALLAI